MSPLEQLLIVQEHDTAIDHLGHRRAHLPERAVVAEAEAVIRELADPMGEVQGRHDAIARDVRRLEDETTVTTERITEVEKTMYSGSVTSPRELQALQADVDQLARHRSSLEDRELALMEQQEQIDAELGALRDRLDAADQRLRLAREVVAREEAAIDAEIASERQTRDGATAGIPPEFLALYEKCRSQTRGIGVARLVGNTCQGCRLTIPATEVDRIRKAGAAAGIAHCDNCGVILVPTL